MSSARVEVFKSGSGMELCWIESVQVRAQIFGEKKVVKIQERRHAAGQS